MSRAARRLAIGRRSPLCQRSTPCPTVRVCLVGRVAGACDVERRESSDVIGTRRVTCRSPVHDGRAFVGVEACIGRLAGVPDAEDVAELVSEHRVEGLVVSGCLGFCVVGFGDVDADGGEAVVVAVPDANRLVVELAGSREAYTRFEHLVVERQDDERLRAVLDRLEDHESKLRGRGDTGTPDQPNPSCVHARASVLERISARRIMYRSRHEPTRAQPTTGRSRSRDDRRDRRRLRRRGGPRATSRAPTR